MTTLHTMGSQLSIPTKGSVIASSLQQMLVYSISLLALLLLAKAVNTSSIDPWQWASIDGLLPLILLLWIAPRLLFYMVRGDAGFTNRLWCSSKSGWVVSGLLVLVSSMLLLESGLVVLCFSAFVLGAACFIAENHSLKMRYRIAAHASGLMLGVGIFLAVAPLERYWHAVISGILSILYITCFFCWGRQRTPLRENVPQEISEHEKSTLLPPKEYRWTMRVSSALWFVLGSSIALIPALLQEVLRRRPEDLLGLAVAAWLGLLLGVLVAGKAIKRAHTVGWIPWVWVLLLIALAAVALGSPKDLAWHITTTPLIYWSYGWQLMASFLLIAASWSFIMSLVWETTTWVAPDAWYRYLQRGGAILFAAFGAWVTRYLYLNGASAQGVVLSLTGVLLVLLLLYFWSIRLEAQRALAVIATALQYRLVVHGLEHVPAHGGVLLVANHVSYFDAVLLLAALPRAARFVVDATVNTRPWFAPFLAVSRVIPVATGFEDRKTLVNAFQEISNALNSNEMVGLFPEGRITYDGQVGKIQPGIRRILRNSPVPVLPVAIVGMWGSVWSRYPASIFRRLFRTGWRKRIDIHISQPILTEDMDPKLLQERFEQLLEKGHQKRPVNEGALTTL